MADQEGAQCNSCSFAASHPNPPYGNMVCGSCQGGDHACDRDGCQCEKCEREKE